MAKFQIDFEMPMLVPDQQFLSSNRGLVNSIFEIEQHEWKKDLEEMVNVVTSECRRPIAIVAVCLSVSSCGNTRILEVRPTRKAIIALLFSKIHVQYCLIFYSS